MDTDLELCTFYSTFFRESLKLNKHGNLRKFKKFLKHEQKGENVDNDAKESKVFKVDLNRKKFAYLFENNVFFSSAVAASFKNVLDKNANLLLRFNERDVINICCFSDGTCAEIVAIVQVLFNASQNLTSHYRFNVTVICFTRSWKSISLQLLKHLEKYQLLREHVKFIIINVSNELPDEVHEAIRNADIITMVKFLSNIRNCTRRFSEVYKDIFRHLKPESIVFFLDCAHQNFFYGINRKLSSCLRLYHKLGYLHILNLETVKHSFKPFDDAFENYFFVKWQKICFGFWINVEGSAYKSNSLSVCQVVPLKTEKRFKTKIVTSNSLLHNSSKKHALSCSIKDSTSEKNYKYRGKSNKSLAPTPHTCSDTEPLSKFEKNVNHKENGITNNKLKLELQKKKANKTGIRPNNSSGFSEQPVLTKTQKKKRNEKRRNQSTLDRKVSSIVEQKPLDILERGTLENRENDLQSSKFPKLHGDESEQSLKSQEKSILFSENKRVLPTQRDVVDYTWDTDSSNIEWAECEFNLSEVLHDVVSLPKTETFCEKNEKIPKYKTELDLQKKKRKPKKLPTLHKTVSNGAEQKPQNSPKRVFREDPENNGGRKNFHSTNLKSFKLHNIDCDESERSLKKQEEFEFLPDNIRFTQTQRNIGNNTWLTEASKIEWTECEVAEFSVEKELHDIPIPETEVLIAKNGKVLSNQEFNSQKKERKKEKPKNQPSPDKTVSNISERKHQGTAELVTEQDGRSKTCYPKPLKHSKLQKMDKSAESLKKQGKSVIFPENIQSFYNQQSIGDDNWDTVANEKEWAGKYPTIPNTSENMHVVPVPKLEGLCEKNENILTGNHFLGKISWNRAPSEGPDVTIYNTGEKLRDVYTPKIDALCEKKEDILTHQLGFDPQKKKRKKGTSKKQPIFDDTVFSNADQKRQDTSKLVIPQESGNPEDIRRCNSTTLEVSKLHNIDMVDSKEPLKSQVESVFPPENIQFSKIRKNIGDYSWDTVVNAIERSGPEVIEHNNNKKLHNASIRKTEALREKSIPIRTRYLPVEEKQFDEVKTYTDLKRINKHCCFTGNSELFNEINNKKSSGESDSKRVEKFEINEKQNLYSNFSTQKLINNEACSHQNVSASMSRPWYISEKVLTAKRRFNSHNQDSKQLSFTNCSNQKLRMNETGRHKTTTALASTTEPHFSAQKVDTKQVKKFETDSKLSSLINCLHQKVTQKEICSRQSVPSSVYEAKPHHPSQNKQPFGEKVASKSLKNRKKEKNKENITSSKSCTDSSTVFFVPDYKNAGTVYTNEEKNIVQGAAMSPEKSFNSFDAGCVARRTIISKGFDEELKIISLTNKSIKSSKWGFSHRGKTQADTQKGVNGAVSKNYIERVSCMMSRNIFHEERIQYFNKKDSRFVGSSPKKLSIFEDKEEKNRQNTVSSLEYVTLPQHYPKKKKKGKAKGKKKKKAYKQTTLPKKGKKKKEEKVLVYSENLKFEFINEDFSVITLAADYANTLSTKVNLIMREDIEENRAFLKTVKVRHKRFSESTDTVLDDFGYGEDGFDSFVPAFNQSSPKNQRWDFWWRKWNWV